MIQLQISDGPSLGPLLYEPVPSVIVPADVNSPTFAWQLDSEPTVPGGGTYGLQANKQPHLQQAHSRHAAGTQQVCGRNATTHGSVGAWVWRPTEYR